MNPSRLFTLPALGAYLITAAGCGTSTPDCGASATTNLVDEILADAMQETFQRDRADFEQFAESYNLTLHPDLSRVERELRNIRTQRFEESIGKYHCQAELKLTMDDRQDTQRLQYTSEQNAEGQHYVEVRGLGEERIGEMLAIMLEEKAAN